MQRLDLESFWNLMNTTTERPQQLKCCFACYNIIPSRILILVRLISGTILDTPTFQFCLHILGYSTFDSDSIHSSYIFRYIESPLSRKHKAGEHNAHVRCHLATQLASVSTTAITPSKYVVVHDAIRSELFVICFQYIRQMLHSKTS